jgi:dTDP-4-amino-4,6-dideoxygalactose transaminase
MEEYGGVILEHLSEVVKSGQLASGALVVETEKVFQEKQDVAHAVMVANGTIALIGALKSQGLKQGDEVIMPAYSFNATMNTVLEVGAHPVLVDIEADTYNIDPSQVRSAITSRTKAIMPVHLYGRLAPMKEIKDIADEYGLSVIEDAAQAHGAKSEQYGSAGSFGVGGFSFYPTKNIAAPEAGMVTTNDDQAADFVRYWRNQGMGKVRYQYEMPNGINARSSNVAAAFVLPQLIDIENIHKVRERNAGLLTEQLSGIEGIICPENPTEETHAWHQYTIRVVPEVAGFTRDELSESLAESGIGSGVYYPKIMSDYAVYDALKADGVIRTHSTRVAEKLAKQVLSLPVHQYVSVEDVERIGDVTKRMMSN